MSDRRSRQNHSGIQEKAEKTTLVVSDGESIKCPNCGEKLPDDIASQLLKTEEKEFSYLVLGVVFGAILGLVGNFWVAFLFEVIKGVIPGAQWLPSSLLGLVIATLVSIYVLVKMLRFTMKHMGVEQKRGSDKEDVKP